MDSMSGGMGVGYACLRLGLIGVLIEKDTTGLYDAAVYRLSLAYRYLSDVDLLCEYGQQPHPLSFGRCKDTRGKPRRAI